MDYFYKFILNFANGMIVRSEKKYRIFLRVLKSMRKIKRMSQMEMATEMGVTQSYISKIEANLRRMDIIELMDYCEAAGLSLTEFSARLEWALSMELTEFKSRREENKKILSFFHLS